MLFASIAGLVLIFAVGALLIFAALRTEALAGWEDRALTSLADSVARRRARLEEKAAAQEIACADGSVRTAVPLVEVAPAPAAKKPKPGQAA
ncbi:MAG: hypothetical protein LBC83_02815 [Oscillospiraceae bacterium]|jgi:hypothetical protein|nr:hypothetical protein [Oscillospiraceae bacterium]